MKKIKIGNKYIGAGEPVYIIAEAGVNHNGNLERAEKMIHVARECGADAVKFQSFTAEKLASKFAEKADYQKVNFGTEGTQLEMLKSLELSSEDFRYLKSVCDKSDIEFLASPFDEDNLDMLVDLGVSAIKFGSGEITNFPLLEKAAGYHIPVLLSTGMATLREIEDAVKIFEMVNNGDLILLQCVSNYPALLEDVNLKTIDTLRNRFEVNVGYSDHTQGFLAAIGAVAFGAVVIEKHFTLDVSLPGPDHAASAEPDELTQMITHIRAIQSALGGGVKEPAQSELATRDIARRSIVAAVTIVEGEKITRDMLAIKRPGTGIAPKHIADFVGKTAKRSVEVDELLTWDVI